MQIKIKKQLKCKRCGYEWNPRKEEVRICPNCKSAYWDKDKRKKMKEVILGGEETKSHRKTL
jgi:Zn finger protein HypA/HybF involved in hydrogenase expression